MILDKLIVQIEADMSKFGSGLDASMSKLNTFGTQATKAGQTLSLGVTAPIVAGATAAGLAAQAYDAATATIRTGTGATGDALAELEGTFESVFTSVPASAEEVSGAVADLNTRLGLTGKPLEDMTTRVVELARISKTTADQIIPAVTRTFGDWGVAAEDQAGALDKLFVVSQNTGVSIDQLGQNMVKYGAPLRQMGFDFDTAAALMGKFEKEGVNAELVMGSLRIALGKMAREGITDTSAALQEITTRIKDAGSTGEANALALEFFGARAGPDMAAAIREGRFEVDDLLATMQGGGDTILAAAEDSMTFADRMAEMKNKVTAAIKPLGQTLLDTFEGFLPTLEKVIGFVQNVADAFSNMPTGVQQGILAFLGIAAAIGPILLIIGQVVSAVTTLMPVISAVAGVLTGPVGLAIAAVIALIVLLVKNWDTVVAAMQPVIAQFMQLWNVIQSSGVIDTIIAGLQNLWAVVQEVFQAIVAFVTPILTEIGAFIQEQFGTVIMWVVQNMPLIKQTIETVMNFIVEAIRFGMNLIQTIWTTVWPVLQDIVIPIWNAIKTVISTVIQTILGIIRAVMQAITGDWSGAWETIKSTATNLISGMLSAIGSLLQGLWGIIKAPFELALTNLKDMATKFLEAGKNLIQSVIDGIKSKIQGIKDAVGDVAQAARNFFPFSPAKEGPLKDLGKVGDGFLDVLGGSISAAANKVPSMMSPFAGAMMDNLAMTPANAVVGAGGGPTYIENRINMEGFEIASDYDVERMMEKMDEILEERRRAAGE